VKIKIYEKERKRALFGKFTGRNIVGSERNIPEGNDIICTIVIFKAYICGRAFCSYDRFYKKNLLFLAEKGGSRMMISFLPTVRIMLSLLSSRSGNL